MPRRIEAGYTWAVAFGRKRDNPPNLKLCPRGAWNDRMLVEATFSMLMQVCYVKRTVPRVWRYVARRLSFTIALFDPLVAWEDLPLGAHGRAHRSLARFSL